MEKTLRVLGTEEGGSGHSHSHSHNAEQSASKASGVEHSVSQNGMRSRKAEKTGEISVPEPGTTGSGPSKLSAYLNLFGDFVHNMYVVILAILLSRVFTANRVVAPTGWRKWLETDEAPCS